MKIITINLPEKYLSAIQTLNDLGIYPSRSEAIRIALRDFLNEELKMDQELEPEIFDLLINSMKKQPIHREHEDLELDTLQLEELNDETMDDLIEEDEEAREILTKEPIITYDNKNTSIHRYRINEQKNETPEHFYNLFPGELYLNLIVSFLKTEQNLTSAQLGDRLGIDRSHVNEQLRKLIKIKSNLLKISKSGNIRTISLDEGVFQEMIIEVCLN